MPQRRRKKKRKTKEKERERATDRELAASNTGWISLLSEHRWTAEGEGESEVGGEGGGEEGKVVSRSVETKHQELQWRQMLVWEPLSKVRPHRWGRCKKQGQVQDQGMEERQEEEVEQEEGEGGGGTRAEVRVGEEVKMRTGEEEGEEGEEEGRAGKETEEKAQRVECKRLNLRLLPWKYLLKQEHQQQHNSKGLQQRLVVVGRGETPPMERARAKGEGGSKEETGRSSR